jgi:diguanylate cyclase (GGDEF)-like protein
MQVDVVLLVILTVSVVAQIVAAWIALHQMANVAGRYRLAWGCVALALALMVERRIGPVWRLILYSETSNFADSVFGLGISLLMAVGIYGVRWLFVDLKELANTDALTGLANRRNVLQLAQQEIERAKRTTRPLAFLMFDIDYFKKVNDTYGHSEGDVVLCAVADIARREFRRIDTVGRIGGEEFLVVLPESDQEGVMATADRFRRAIAEKEFSLGANHLGITVSIGVVAPHNMAGVITVEDVLKAADKALYAAKKGGRNRVAVIDQGDCLVALNG